MQQAAATRLLLNSTTLSGQEVMKPKKVILSESQFQELNRVSGWKTIDIPPEVWMSTPGLPRREDTIAMMGSADVNCPKVMHGISVVLGFDQIVEETNPKPNEPEINTYHFVVQKIFVEDPQYVMHGPFRDGTRPGHWTDLDNLSCYWPQEPDN